MSICILNCCLKWRNFINLWLLFSVLVSFVVAGVCTNATAPSVSSINRILRNRAAERAAAEFARAAGYGLYPPNPYSSFAWPATAHLWSAGSGFPGISPGSATTSGTACSPGSGSHDTLGSPDGNRLIGKLIYSTLFERNFHFWHLDFIDFVINVNLLIIEWQIVILTLFVHDFLIRKSFFRCWRRRFRQFRWRTAKIPSKSYNIQSRAIGGTGKRVWQIALSMRKHERTLSVTDIIERSSCAGENLTRIPLRSTEKQMTKNQWKKRKETKMKLLN